MTSSNLANAKTELPDEYLTKLLRSESEPEPSSQISRTIHEQYGQALTPARPMAAGRRLWLSLALCLSVTLGFAFVNGFRMTGAAAAGLYGVMAWALVQAGLLLVGFGKPGRLPLLAKALVVIVIPGSFFLFLGLMGETSSFAEIVGHSHSGGIIRCGGLALGAGMLTAFGIMFLWRRTDPFDPGFSGSIAGLVGGLAGALAIGLVCRDHGAWHLWLGHGLCVIALIVLGRAIGRRWLSP